MNSKPSSLVLSLSLLLLFQIGLQAAPIRVLIIDGQNNHNWKAMTPVMRHHLQSNGQFSVEVSTTPPSAPGIPRNLSPEQRSKAEKAASELKLQLAEAWKSWNPDFTKYDVIVSNYNGEDWPQPVRTAFESYIRTGGKFVCIHAANNAFPNWPEYNQIIGLGGWGDRTEKHGPYVYFDDNGKEVRDTRPGSGGSHGPQHEFIIELRKSHPITQGMPPKWKHSQDELYDSLRGPAENMEILATAWSEKSKRHEPMMMVIRYGKGTVFHTPMGHENGKSLQCVGFITTLHRACEWLATGKVTLPIPQNFPTPEHSSTVSLARSPEKAD